MMLSTFLLKNPQKSTIKEGYDLLTEREKRQIRKHIEAAKLDRNEDFSQHDIISVKPILSGASVHIETNVRTIHLTTRSFWSDSPAVKSTKAIIAIGEAANQREAKRLAERQKVTNDTLVAYIAERRANRPVAVAAA